MQNGDMISIPMIPLSAARTPSSPFPRALGRALAHTRSVALALRHRREVMQLCAWDDRQLEDIGLTRSDVVGALQAPLTRDPSQVLAARSVRRRAGAAVRVGSNE